MLSRISYILCSLVMLYACFFFYPKWNNKWGEAVIGWDVSGYYWYLPSAFIYKDLKHQAFGDSIINKYSPTHDFEQSYLNENGNRIITYSAGMALMYLPLFTIAHLSAKPLGYSADGFSVPYQFAIQMGSLLIALIGIWYFRRLMLMFYEDKVVALLLLLLVIGTNYLNYSAIDGAQTHNWLFTIYVFLLLNTINFYKTPSYKYAVRIGLLCGLAILIRPSEMIAVFIPLLWGMETISLKAIQEKIHFLLQHFKKLLVASVCVILVGSIQVAYWMYVAGKPFVYSYVGKTFSWKHPHFADYMFSYRSGWVTYTPMMFLVLLGVLSFLFKGKNKVAILAFFAINLYIVCAWDIWWYGGTGGRAMIQSYPIIFFPFASLLQLMFEKRILKWILTPALLVFTYFNLWFTYNAHAINGLYDAEGMTSQYFWRVVLRSGIPISVNKLKDTDELFEGTPKKMTLLATNNYESDTSIHNMIPPAIDGGKSVYLDMQQKYSPATTIPYNPEKHTDWVRVQATFRCKYREVTNWRMTQMVVRFMDKGNIVKERMIRVPRFLAHNTTKDVYLDVKQPREHFDSIQVFFWQAESEQPIWIDNLKIWSFNE